MLVGLVNHSSTIQTAIITTLLLKLSQS